MPVQLSNIAGWTNPGVTGSGGNEQPTPQLLRGADMKTPTLVPRKFKIDHDANEYTYFVEWVMSDRGNRWGISNPNGFFLRANYAWDYQGFDTLMFDTPEEALEGWKKYIEAKGK